MIMRKQGIIGYSLLLLIIIVTNIPVAYGYAPYKPVSRGPKWFSLLLS